MDAAAFEQVYGARGFSTLTSRRCLAAGRRGEHSGHYLQALLVQSGERRNAENLSETVPGSARGMQRFLTDSPWDDEAIIRTAAGVPGNPAGASGRGVGAGRQRLSQAGTEVAEVARQYCGRLGKVANCQAGMFLAYVSPLGRALVDKRLYLPESWTSDKDRCEAAGVPENRQGYRRRRSWPWRWWGGAQERAHLKAGWVAADDAFGMSPSFRDGWRPWGCGTCWTFRPALRCGRRSLPGPMWSIRDSGVPASRGSAAGSGGTMQERSDELPEAAWHELTVAEGSQGPRQLPVQCPAGASTSRRKPGEIHWAILPPESGRQRTPLLSVQCTGGYPVGDPGIRGRIPLAYRNGVRDGKERRGAGRVRDPHLVGLASPRGPVPAGRSFSAEPATGLGGKRMPRITRPQVYRVVREMLPRARFGPEELLRWLEDTQDSNERAQTLPCQAAAPPCGHHPTSLPEPSL